VIWGHQAVVDNRPGGGGSIAARAGQTATPDGYTLYVGAASTFTALKGAPGVAPNLPIELPRDFTAIGFLRLFGIFSSHLDCAAPITADI
jgi:tripartite-type tricarboxylate transporter receptor subunit TctC